MRATRSRSPRTRLILAAVTGLLASGVLVAGCDPGTVVEPARGVDDRSLSAAEQSQYLEDAAHLSLRQMARDAPLDEQPPRIPDTLWLSLYGALVHVHNATDLAARDSVVEEYAIHAYPRPMARELMVVVDSAADWVVAWLEGRSLTGDPAVDSLVVRYDLGVADVRRWVGEWIVLRAMRDPLNIGGLVPLFEAIPDVLFAKPDNIFGDGDDIQAVAEADGWRLTYYLKWDDCPATCLAAHHWTFRVGPRGAVEYLGSGGDPVP